MMASLKDSSSSRPLTQSIPHSRQSNGRPHSHSVSLGALNFNHRVTRRKSMNASAASSAAAAAAAAVLNESGGGSGSPITPHHRRGLSVRRAAAGTESTSMGTPSSFGYYVAQNSLGSERKQTPTSSGHKAMAGSPSTTSTANTTTGNPISTKHRSRRASEGSHLIKGEGKRSLTELKCDRCGKGYKHSSCLTKHMWEHDPAWAYTSKLLISKHQQVQLLEAASVLVTMNHEPSDCEIPATGDSERSSASPTASGISELRGGLSSTETTPPPISEDGVFTTKPGDGYRFGGNNMSSAFSRSFQSVPSSSFAGSAPSYSPARSHFRQSSTDTRPSTADTGVLDDDAMGLAAAIELCNFGTPRTGPSTMLTDVPPVPPLPARYLGQSLGSNNAMNVTPSQNINMTGNSNNSISGETVTRPDTSSTPTIFNSLSLNAPPSYRISDERDVKMDDVMMVDKDLKHHRHKPSTSSSSPDDDFDRSSTAVPMDDEDDGVFGRMEE